MFCLSPFCFGIVFNNIIYFSSPAHMALRGVFTHCSLMSVQALIFPFFYYLLPVLVKFYYISFNLNIIFLYIFEFYFRAVLFVFLMVSIIFSLYFMSSCNEFRNVLGKISLASFFLFYPFLTLY